jgi:hypothetical protein
MNARANLLYQLAGQSKEMMAEWCVYIFWGPFVCVCYIVRSNSVQVKTNSYIAFPFRLYPLLIQLVLTLRMAELYIHTPWLST